MSATTESLKNYFKAAENFLDSWVNFLAGMAPEGEQSEVQKSAKEYKKQMNDFMGKFEKFAEDQIQKSSNMSPQEVQSENLKALDDFQEGFNKYTQAVNEMLEKERDYVSSDAYLSDVENNKSAVESIYNSSLDNVSKMFNNYADFFNNLKK